MTVLGSKPCFTNFPKEHYCLMRAQCQELDKPSRDFSSDGIFDGRKREFGL